MAQDLNKEASAISGMFNSIAASYDRLNHTLSFGVDILWRRKLISKLKQNRVHRVLDVACGTGDLTMEIARHGYEVTGMDIAEKMVDVAKRKDLERMAKARKHGEGSERSSADFVICSAEELPFADATFDAVTISFGIRNFNNRQQCLSEIYRVTRQGGSLYILEFALPSNKIWKAIYLFYLKNILPMVGRAVSKDRSAYSYLSDSIQAFPRYEAFCDEIRQAGYFDVKYYKCSGGIALLYVAIK